MVDVQFGDDVNQHRLDDVGAVESSAQAYLNHGQVDGFCFEMNKSSRGDGFKEGWFKVDTLGDLCNLVMMSPKAALSISTADRDALTNIDGADWCNDRVYQYRMLSTMCETDPLPLVPATWMQRTLSCGLPNACINFCMRSSHFHRGEPSQACFSKSTNWFNHRLAP